MMREKTKLNRRHFIKSTLAGTTGIFLSPLLRAEQNKTNGKKILYRDLGKTGIRLPVISMGMMNCSDAKLLRAALDSGVAHIDTAHAYYNGKNEELIGKVMADYPRDSIVVATKILGNNKDKKTWLYTAKTSEDEFIKMFEISLKRLGLDYVDILYLHDERYREATLFEPLLNALSKIKNQGKARFVGVSTHSNEPEVIHAVIDSKFYDVVLTAYNHKQDHYKEMREATTKAAKAGIGIIAMKPIPGGYELEKEKINATAALKWVLQNPNVTTVIPGISNFSQLEMDLSVMKDLTLNEKEQKDLEMSALRPGIYCQGCQKCLKECKDNLPVPDLMRAYMYAFGYRNVSAAQDLLQSLKLNDTPCANCEVCTVNCTKGFHVANRIEDLDCIQEEPDKYWV
jgi:predicted aldo/keto reductase-like oxidoreductase